MTCKNCGHDQSYRKLNRDGTAYIVLCSKCARLIRIELRKEAFCPKEKTASGN